MYVKKIQSNSPMRHNFYAYGISPFSFLFIQDETTMEIVEAKAIDKGLLDKNEIAAARGNAVIPLLWISKAITDRIYAEKLPGAEHKETAVRTLLLGMRSGIGGVACACSSFGLTPLPLVHLMSALVKMVSKCSAALLRVLFIVCLIRCT